MADGATQLWRTDGTVAGTFMLIDRMDDLRDELFAVVNDSLYFLVAAFNPDTDSSEQLWRSDGTVAGTGKVAEYETSLTISQLGLAAIAGKLFFVAPRAGQDVFSEIWVSDGTAGGTAPLTTFDQAFVSAPTAVGKKLLFFATPSSGQTAQLRASDGIHAETTLLATFAAVGGMGGMTVEGSSLYFEADDGIHGRQVWVSDGTAAGTRQLTSAPSGFVGSFELAGSNLVLLATTGHGTTALWGVTPGSGGALVPLCPQSCDSVISTLFKSGSHVVFASGSFDGGYAVWASDGTPGGTVMLKQTCGAGHGCTDSPALTAVGPVLYFNASGSELDLDELWRTDGTRAGTRRFAAPPIDPNDLTAPAGFAGKVFFASPKDAFSDTELWLSDGTPAGTRQLTDATLQVSSAPASLTAVGGQVVFSAVLSGFETLWRSGGTASTTVPVPGSQAFGGSPAVAAFGGVVFAGADSQLWRSDGTAAGTLPLTDFSPPLAVSPALLPVGSGSQVFFLVQPTDGTTASVWKSDGTPRGTAEAFVLPSPNQGIVSLALVGSDLYFVLLDDEGFSLLWKSDGTASGTIQLTGPGGPLMSTPVRFVQLGGKVYFTDDDGTLWQTDGTMAETLPAALADSLVVTELAASGGALYLTAQSFAGSHPFALWRSDGTPGGTAILQTFPDGADDPAAGGLTPFAGGLAFFANDGVHGNELWVTGGTAASTAMVRDIQPGEGGSYPHELTAVGGRLFFTADDGDHGNELWVSDGTAAGTRLVQDINPGLQASNPFGMTAAGSLLYFAANDGLTGIQLWALPLTGPSGCQASATALCLLGGRFKVEVFWEDFQGNSGTGQASVLTADTGTFWFFDPANVELVVKMLDGRALNDSFWVFYGALSNVQYWLTITDTQTGVARRYLNPLGALASVGDTTAFGPMGAASNAAPAVPAAQAAPRQPHAALSTRSTAREAELASAPALREAPSACQTGPSQLCLNGGRFALTARWQDFNGNTGTGSAVTLTDETGYLWFFDAANVETVIKVIDGRGLNGHFWVFYGALSNVQYTLTFTDTVTGAVKTYTNPAGELASVADTTAF